jgi:hypothetical protein
MVMSVTPTVEALVVFLLSVTHVDHEVPSLISALDMTPCEQVGRVLGCVLPGRWSCHLRSGTVNIDPIGAHA